ncbi:hypothetical protein K402DRAFT_340860 [Aulographum hederae CBS 113979]|uniref:Uncharacterized protein n=1 Tax=Aulographum hederae CBS 113979 TaxID=1176131 RepID=A0A6G1GMW5_9PEZI|nr:hypothetical protein K402DRAFT_340860 [Aulographum hederae CBS 113979]
MLPDELILASVNEQYPCRELQIRQLSTLYNHAFPSPPSLVVHGSEATGKTSVVKAILEANKLPFAFVNSRECITGRHLLERTIAACLDALDASSDELIDRTPYVRCESISALSVHLQRLLEDHERLVLVFDAIDKQREAPPTLLPAMARFGEIIPNLSVIFIVALPRPRFLHTAGTPHLHFPPYSRDQSISILSTSPLPIFLEPIAEDIDYTEEEAEEDSAWLWTRYCAAIWDSIAKGAARDLVSFRGVCEKLWRPFVQPIIDGKFGTRDFSRLLIANRTLLQGEDALLESIVPKTVGGNQKLARVTHDLPYYSKYLLCAAYLASFNPPRQDQLYFMKNTERKRKKKGGAAGRAAKHRKIPRHLLNPSAFPLDRLLAILHAILPHDLPPTADIFTQIATLSSLRLLLRTGAAGGDVLDAGCKWRVNFGWEYVSALGRNVQLEMADYLASGGD